MAGASSHLSVLQPKYFLSTGEIPTNSAVQPGEPSTLSSVATEAELLLEKGTVKGSSSLATHVPGRSVVL